MALTISSVAYTNHLRISHNVYKISNLGPGMKDLNQNSHNYFIK